jgi:hypothetical protein
MYLTRLIQFPEPQQDPEPAALCGQVMASVIRTQSSWQCLQGDLCNVARIG